MLDPVRIRRYVALIFVVAIAMFATSAVSAERPKIAFLAASSQNGFNQAIFEGINQRARERGDVDVEILDGEFNGAKQYSQVEDLVAAGKFDGMIILPNDSVGIANALSDAIGAGRKVVTVLFPVGPKLDTLEPQIPGLTATIASNSAIGAKRQAEGVIAYCADKDPCNVVIIIGLRTYPYDDLRYRTYLETLAGHENIKLVGTVEGNYDPDKAMSGMQNVLQAHPDVNVILSNADQHLVGAEIALQDAGIKVESLYLSGGGASQTAIEAICAGRWKATLAYFPFTIGRYAIDAVVDSLQGKKINPVIDSDLIGPVPAMIDKSVLDAHPDFKGEWPG